MTSPGHPLTGCHWSVMWTSTFWQPILVLDSSNCWQSRSPIDLTSGSFLCWGYMQDVCSGSYIITLERIECSSHESGGISSLGWKPSIFSEYMFKIHFKGHHLLKASHVLLASPSSLLPQYTVITYFCSFAFSANLWPSRLMADSSLYCGGV